MGRTAQRSAGSQALVMIFHENLPVAVSPVADRSPRSLQVAGDPPGFEPDTLLVLQIASEGGSGRSWEWLAGVVEGADEQRLRIRLDSATTD